MALAEDDVLAFLPPVKQIRLLFLRELQLDQELEMLQKLIDCLF